MTSEKESIPLSIGQAIQEISHIEQLAQVMGANDYETSAFEQIRKEVLVGNISPQEAVKKANAILESKNDYH